MIKSIDTNVYYPETSITLYEINHEEKKNNKELSDILKNVEDNKNNYLSLRDISNIEKITTSNVRKNMVKYGIKSYKMHDRNSLGQEILIFTKDDVVKYFNLKYGIKNE